MAKPTPEQMSFEDLQKEATKSQSESGQTPRRYRPPATYTFRGKERTVPDKPRPLTSEQRRAEAVRDRSRRIGEN